MPSAARAAQDGGSTTKCLFWVISQWGGHENAHNGAEDVQAHKWSAASFAAIHMVLGCLFCVLIVWTRSARTLSASCHHHPCCSVMADRPPSAVSETLQAAANTPLSDYDPPRASYLAASDASPRESSYASPSGSSPLLSGIEKEAVHDDAKPQEVRNKRRPPVWIAYASALLIVVVLAVILPVYFTVIKRNQRSGETSASNNGQHDDAPANGTQTPPTAPTIGGDGSTVTTDDGSTFTYNNKFGGFCKCFGLSNSYFRSSVTVLLHCDLSSSPPSWRHIRSAYIRFACAFP